MGKGNRWITALLWADGDERILWMLLSCDEMSAGLRRIYNAFEKQKQSLVNGTSLKRPERGERVYPV